MTPFQDLKKNNSLLPKSKISNPLPSILDQSRTSARPMLTYIDIGVSFNCFKYPETLKCFTKNVIAKLYFPRLCCQTKYILFHYKKIKVKKVIAVVKLFLYFSFFMFFPFQCLSCIYFWRFFFHFWGKH